MLSGCLLILLIQLLLFLFVLKEYKLCTKAYLAEGRDGYEVFKSLPVIVSTENILYNYNNINNNNNNYTVCIIHS